MINDVLFTLGFWLAFMGMLCAGGALGCWWEEWRERKALERRRREAIARMIRESHLHF